MFTYVIHQNSWLIWTIFHGFCLTQIFLAFCLNDVQFCLKDSGYILLSTGESCQFIISWVLLIYLSFNLNTFCSKDSNSVDFSFLIFGKNSHLSWKTELFSPSILSSTHYFDPFLGIPLKCTHWTQYHKQQNHFLHPFCQNHVTFSIFFFLEFMSI